MVEIFVMGIDFLREYIIIPQKKGRRVHKKLIKMRNHFILSWEFGPQKIFPNPKIHIESHD